MPALILSVGCLGLLGSKRQGGHGAGAPAERGCCRIRFWDSPARIGSFLPKNGRFPGVSQYAFRVFGADSGVRLSIYVGYYEAQFEGKTIHSSPRTASPAPAGNWSSQGHGAGCRGYRFPVNRGMSRRTRDAGRFPVYYWYQGRGRVSDE